RRYVPSTNVLETTFRTAEGAVRVTDALTLHDGAVLPWRELVRRVEGLSGRVAMRWHARGSSRVEEPSWSVLAWEAGGDGRFEIRQGGTALLALVADEGPCPRPTRDEIEERLGGTVAAWRRWIGSHTHEGRWADEVARSLLALKLLIC